MSAANWTFEKRLQNLSAGIQASRSRAADLYREGESAQRGAPSVNLLDLLVRATEEIRIEQDLLKNAEDQLREQLVELERTASHAKLERERFRKLFDGGID